MRKTGQAAFAILLIYLIIAVSPAAITVGIDNNQSLGQNRIFSRDIQWISSARAESASENADLKWFRDKMKISPKYVERHEGVMGVSWAHFLSMVFLAIFTVGAFIVFIMQHKRTKEILRIIKEEKDHGNDG